MVKDKVLETSNRLREIIDDPVCEHMNKSSVIGFYGELQVYLKLLDEGYDVYPKGNQSGYDLGIVDGAKVDVKCSRIKGTQKHPDYGFALHSGSKRRSITATHFVCVGLGKTFEPYEYYVVKAGDISEFLEGPGRFKNVKASMSIILRGYPQRSPGNQYFDKNLKALRAEFVRRRLPSEELGIHLQQ